MPVYVSVNDSPRRAGAVLPTKCRPIWEGSGWVQRMPCGFMIVTKSTSASRTTPSAYGWSTADGSGARAAARTEGESATDRATAMACRAAASSACSRALR
ncbi:hypothetical protein GCM10020256_22240 [Streptomyces thermocoprophilus]